MGPSVQHYLSVVECLRKSRQVHKMSVAYYFFFFVVCADVCLNVNIHDVNRGYYKNARFVKHQGHTEWARQGQSTDINMNHPACMYSPDT